MTLRRAVAVLVIGAIGSLGGPAPSALGWANGNDWELVRSYDNHGYNAKVHRITKGQLQRAANAVADLITSS